MRYAHMPDTVPGKKRSPLMKTIKTLLRILSTAGCAGVLLGAAVAVQAQINKAPSIRVDTPWTRVTPSSASTGVGYLTLTNHGREPDRLIGVQSSVAGRAEIHTMETTDNVMRMRWLKDGLEIPAGKSVELKPGGVHIMLMELAKPIQQGTPVPITLVLQKAGNIDVRLEVAPMGATRSPSGHGTSTTEHGAHGGHAR